MKRSTLKQRIRGAVSRPAWLGALAAGLLVLFENFYALFHLGVDLFQLFADTAVFFNQTGSLETVIDRMLENGAIGQRQREIIAHAKTQVAEQIIGIAAVSHDNNRQVGRQFEELLKRAETVRLRQMNIDDDKIRTCRMKTFDTLFRIVGEHYMTGNSAQRRRDETTHHFIIVYDQDGEIFFGKISGDHAVICLLHLLFLRMSGNCSELGRTLLCSHIFFNPNP